MRTRTGEGEVGEDLRLGDEKGGDEDAVVGFFADDFAKPESVGSTRTSRSPSRSYGSISESVVEINCAESEKRSVDRPEQRQVFLS